MASKINLPNPSGNKAIALIEDLLK